MRDEIQKLRLALARRESGRGKRFSPKLRQRIAAAAGQLRLSGASWSRIGDELGIPMETARRLCNSDRPGFTAVEVVDDGSHGLVLVTPGGFRIEGLTPDGVATLIRKLA